jgi:hypothetical protein
MRRRDFEGVETMSSNQDESARRPGSGIRRLTGERGMAMMTVLVFSFVFIVGIMAFFTVNAYEANQAEMREHSTRAFFLADGAIERAKMELVGNINWTTGYAWTNYDGGRYKLTVNRDTTWNGLPSAHFYAEGVFGRNKRDVEVFAKILPPTDSLAIWAGGDIDTQGNIDLVGHAHANDDMDGSHFRGPGTFDGGYVIRPPAVYTEPDSFPGATYYYVTGSRTANPDELYIKDRNGVTVATFIDGGAPVHAEFDWGFAGNVLEVEVDQNGGGPHVFDYNVGPFRHLGADHAVVINFGQGTINQHDRTDLNMQSTGNVAEPIECTIINARYTGGNTSLERYNKANWYGGTFDMYTNLLFEPRYCIALIVKQINNANAQDKMGSQAHPALVYVVGDIPSTAGQLTVVGSLLVLGDAGFGGGSNLAFNKAFIDCLPPVLKTNWPSNTSGEMVIYEWREPAPKAIS